MPVFWPGTRTRSCLIVQFIGPRFGVAIFFFLLNVSFSGLVVTGTGRQPAPRQPQGFRGSIGRGFDPAEVIANYTVDPRGMPLTGPLPNWHYSKTSNAIRGLGMPLMAPQRSIPVAPPEPHVSAVESVKLSAPGSITITVYRSRLTYPRGHGRFHMRQLHRPADYAIPGRQSATRASR